MPHSELVHMDLDHSSSGSAMSVVPPAGPSGSSRARRRCFTEGTEHGNSIGGSGTAQLDLPRAIYQHSPPEPMEHRIAARSGPDGGFERPKMTSLYGDRLGYLDRCARRLDELGRAGMVPLRGRRLPPLLRRGQYPPPGTLKALSLHDARKQAAASATIPIGRRQRGS